MQNLIRKEDNKMDISEKKVKENLVYDGKILKLYVDDAELSNGKITKREYCNHPGGVAIIPIDDDGNVTLVRQFRYPYGCELLEIPAGKLEPGENPLECGIRELEEETGMKAEEFISLGVAYPSPGYVNEKLYLYMAKELSQGVANPDEDEFLNVIKMPFSQLFQMVMTDEIHDAKTVIAALKAKFLIEG